MKRNLIILLFSISTLTSCHACSPYTAYWAVKSISLAGETLVMISEEPAVKLLFKVLDDLFQRATDKTAEKGGIVQSYNNPLKGTKQYDLEYAVVDPDGHSSWTIRIPKHMVTFERLDAYSQVWEMDLRSKIMVEERLSLASIQLALVSKSNYNGNIDGICGRGTLRAIRNFQKDKGISPLLRSCNQQIDTYTKEMILKNN